MIGQSIWNINKNFFEDSQWLALDQIAPVGAFWTGLFCVHIFLSEWFGLGTQRVNLLL